MTRIQSVEKKEIEERKKEKSDQEDVCDFILLIILAMADAAAKKIETEKTVSTSSPVDKLLDDSCPELLLYKNSAFTKEKVVKATKPEIQSLMSPLMKNASGSATKTGKLLPVPDKKDKNRMNMTVYLLSTPQSIKICLSKTARVEEVIVHILTSCLANKALSQLFITDPLGKFSEEEKDSSLYELRLLEDEDSKEFYLPLMDIAPLDRQKSIGEFSTDSFAFCQIKNYRKTLETISKSFITILLM